MADTKETPEKFFQRLTRIFKHGVRVHRKINTKKVAPDKVDRSQSSASLLFQKTFSPTYAAITSNAYNIAERLNRYQDFVQMEQTAEIAVALDLWADESTSPGENGRILHVFSDNESIKQCLEDLFYNVLNIEFNARSWSRNLCKFGDLFLLLDVHPQLGVTNVYPIPVNEIEREEGYDRDNPSAHRFKWLSANRTLYNWEVAHFRLLGDDAFLPYGCSLIDAARRAWRQLILIEDAMLVYRVTRAPERRVFYVDVGNMNANDIPNYIEQQKQTLRLNQVVDSATSRVDMRYNPLSVEEDYVIPVRGGESGTKIDTLQAGQNTGTVEDVQYIRQKLISALKVPKAYIGFEEGLSSKAGLAQLDVRFSRSVSVIQRTIIAELNKIAIIHLYSRGFDNEDLTNFTLRLSNPSTVAEQQKLELWRAKFEIGGSLPEGMGTKQFVYKKIWGLTDEEIDNINNQRVKETAFDAMIASLAEGGEDAGAGGGAGGFAGLDAGGDSPELEGGDDADVFSDEDGTAEPAGDEETPPEENASEEPPEEEDDELDLLTSSDDHDHDPSPIPQSGKGARVSNQLSKSLYNRSRRRHAGRDATLNPDHLGMLNSKRSADTMNDPYDSSSMRAFVKDSLGESMQVTPLTVDRQRMLADMANILNINRTFERSILAEIIDIDEEEFNKF